MNQYNQFYHPVLIKHVQLSGNLFLAPVAGYSDCAFRTLCIDGGANFTYTEMVSSEALVRQSGKTEELMRRAPNESQYAVQLFGGNAETMAQAAVITVQKVAPSIIDINAGCPVPKIVKTGAGSALTRDPSRLYDVTRAVVHALEGLNASAYGDASGGQGATCKVDASNARGVSCNADATNTRGASCNSDGTNARDATCNGNASDGGAAGQRGIYDASYNRDASDAPDSSANGAGFSRCAPACESRATPVTVKIRSGWDESHLSWKEAALAAIEAGASAVTLHARTRAQGYEGKADRTVMAELVQLVNGRVPVFASGDVFSPQAARDIIEQTGVDGVMFARGAMGNPFIFDETRRFLLNGEEYQTPSTVRIKAGMKELGILIAQKGEQSACREMRKRFCAYSKGIQGGAALRERIVSACTRTDFEHIFSEYL